MDKTRGSPGSFPPLLLPRHHRGSGILDARQIPNQRRVVFFTRTPDGRQLFGFACPLSPSSSEPVPLTLRARTDPRRAERQLREKWSPTLCAEGREPSPPFFFRRRFSDVLGKCGVPLRHACVPPCVCVCAFPQLPADPARGVDVDARGRSPAAASTRSVTSKSRRPLPSRLL